MSGSLKTPLPIPPSVWSKYKQDEEKLASRGAREMLAGLLNQAFDEHPVSKQPMTLVREYKILSARNDAITLAHSGYWRALKNSTLDLVGLPDDVVRLIRNQITLLE